MGRRVSSIDLATTYLLADEQALKRLRHPAMRRLLRQHPDLFTNLQESRIEEEAYLPEHILTSLGILDYSVISIQ